MVGMDPRANNWVSNRMKMNIKGLMAYALNTSPNDPLPAFMNNERIDGVALVSN